MKKISLWPTLIRNIWELYERYYRLAKLILQRVTTRNVKTHKPTINRKGTTSRWFLNSGRQRAKMSGNICKKKLQFRTLVVEGDTIKTGLVCPQKPRESEFSDTRGAREEEE